MPGVDGLEATRRIGASEGAHWNVPNGVLTAQALSQQVMECRGAGSIGYGGKLFMSDALLEAILLAVGPQAARTDTKPAKPDAPQRTTAWFDAREPIRRRTEAAPSYSLLRSELELASLDQHTSGRTAGFLPHETAANYLQSIVERSEALLRGLDAAVAVAHAGENVAEAAHTLAGSVSIFGLKQLDMVALNYERGTQTGAMDVFYLIQSLRAAIPAALQKLRHPNVVEAK
jgi:CheY-like chemotaxis protein